MFPFMNMPAFSMGFTLSKSTITEFHFSDPFSDFSEEHPKGDKVIEEIENELTDMLRSYEENARVQIGASNQEGMLKAMFEKETNEDLHVDVVQSMKIIERAEVLSADYRYKLSTDRKEDIQQTLNDINSEKQKIVEYCDLIENQGRDDLKDHLIENYHPLEKDYFVKTDRSGFGEVVLIEELGVEVIDGYHYFWARGTAYKKDGEQPKKGKPQRFIGHGGDKIEHLFVPFVVPSLSEFRVGMKSHHEGFLGLHYQSQLFSEEKYGLSEDIKEWVSKGPLRPLDHQKPNIQYIMGTILREERKKELEKIKELQSEEEV